MRITSNLNITVIISLTALVFGYILARLFYNHAMLISVLMAGMPLLLLAPFSATRRIALILLIVLVPLTGIFKPLTGIRYAPITFDIGILLACVFDLIDRILQRNLRFDILDYLMGAFFVLALLQMFNPNVPGLRAGIEGFRKFAFMSVAFYAGRHILKFDDLKRFQKLILPISSLIALYGLKQFFYMSEFDYKVLELSTGSLTTYLLGGWIRPFSILPGPFHLGLYLLITILFIIGYLLHGKRQLPIWILMLLVLSIQSASLFVTRTKGNWIALLIGITVLILLQQRGSRIWQILSIATFIGIIIAGLQWVMPSITVSEIFFKSVSDAANLIQAPTLQFRLALWKYSIFPALKLHPLLGYGTSSAGEGLAHLYRGLSASYFYSHNLYFKVSLELGIIGFFLFITIIGMSVYKGGVRVIQARDLPEERSDFGIICIAVIGAFLSAGLVAPVLDAAPINYYFWLLLGFLSKLHQTGRYDETGDDSLS
jgi:O-antigen ligase